MGPLIHQTESLDIVGSPTNQNRIISEFPKCGITVDAEKGANLSRLMIMVDAHSGGEHLQTESTTKPQGVVACIRMAFGYSRFRHPGTPHHPVSEAAKYTVIPGSVRIIVSGGPSTAAAAWITSQTSVPRNGKRYRSEER